MSDTLKSVQDQHANYSKMLGDKQTYLTQIVNQMKQLRNERKTVLSHIAELTGAVNMAAQVIDKLKSETPATSAPAVVEGEVVQGA